MPLRFLLTFLLASFSAIAADIPKPFAHYRSEDIRAEGASVQAWADQTTAARTLDRVAGKPRVRLVSTPSGEKRIVCLDGRSAIWQASNAWGTLDGDRTIILLARVASKEDGFLFDGSTKSGSAPAQVVAGKWKTAATVSSEPQPGAWQVLTFVFPKDPPLGGFILGANVAAASGLACDVAEVMVFDQKLDPTQLTEISSKLTANWGTPVDLPNDKQPRDPTFTDDPRVFRTTVRKQHDEGVHTYRIPGLATTPKGTLIAVFDIRHASGGDLPANIDVGLMRSTDNGETWGAMKTILDFDDKIPNSRGNGVGDPAVLVDQRTGRIIVAALHSKGNRAWFGSGPGMTEEETGQFVLTHSDDDGLTWTKSTSINSQIKDPKWNLVFNGPGSGIQLRNGDLVFPAQFKDANKQPHSCFVASADGGNTWKISPAAIPGKPPTSESQIVELSDGSLLLTMRNEAHEGKRAWAKWTWKDSIMNGQWSPHWLDVTDPTCMASIIRHPSGKLIFSNPNNPNKRVALTIRTSDDDGKTWSAGKLLDPAFSMYSCLTVLKDGRIGLLYESGDTAGLVFVRFPLEWTVEADPVKR